MNELKVYNWVKSLMLEKGESLPNVTFGYHAYGNLNPDCNNVSLFN